MTSILRILEEFKTCLGNSLDDSAYKTLRMMIEMCQTIYDKIALKSKKVAGKYLKQKSNFSNETTFIFKDLNDFKATACVELMKKMEQTIGNCAPTVAKTCRSEQGKFFFYLLFNLFLILTFFQFIML
jgi:hypothetical protein